MDVVKRDGISPFNFHPTTASKNFQTYITFAVSYIKSSRTYESSSHSESDRFELHLGYESASCRVLGKWSFSLGTSLPSRLLCCLDNLKGKTDLSTLFFKLDRRPLSYLLSREG